MSKSSFVFIGRSGSGKGTQASLLLEFLKKKNGDRPVIYLEIGQKFRDFVQKNGHSSTLAKSIMDKAGLQPDFLTIWILTDSLIEELKGNEDLIIDGSPRSLRQAQVVDGALDFYGFMNKTIVYLNITAEESRRRLKERARADDVSDEMVSNRQSWFEQEILPAIEYYRNESNCHLLEIDGSKSSEEIHEEIIKNYDQTKN